MTNAVRFNQFSRIPVLACLTLGLVLLFFVPAPALGQAFVQVISNAGPSAQFAGAQTAGDLNVVVIGWGGVASVTGVIDTAGNTYLPAGGTFGTSSGVNTISQAIFYAANIKAAGPLNTVTVTFNTTAGAPDLRLLEYSGLSATFPLETASGGTGSGASASSGSVTYAANSVIVAGGTTSIAFGASPNFTSRILDADGNIAGDIIAASGGNTSATDAATGSWVLQAAVFGAAATNLPAPTIAASGGINPNTGGDIGGTAVAITGTNFAAGASVKFGTFSGVNCAVANSTTINCLTPAEGSSTVNVTVTNVDGQSAVSLASAMGGGFQFQPDNPSIGTIAPTTGPTNGATSLTISGGNFLPGATVKVNDLEFETPGLPALPAGNVVVSSSSTLTFNNPALPSGTADITVTNPDGGTVTAPGIFTYAPVAGGVNYVQRADAAVARGSSQNPPAPMLNPETKGDLNVVIAGWADTAAMVTGVSDSEGNTYVAALPTVNGVGLSQAIYYAKNILGDGVTPNTITVHFNRGASSPDIRVLEYNGLDTNNPLDTAVGAFDAAQSNVADTGACTTTGPGELVVAGATVATNVTGPDPDPATPYLFAMTDITTNGNGAEQEVLSAAGSCQAKMQLSSTQDWVIQAATFKTVAANFTLTPTPATLTVGAGSNASYAIAVNAINGFTSPVTFTTCAGLPASDGLSCSVSPASVNPGSSATLTITTSATTPLAAYSNITVTGTSGVLTQMATVSLKVTAAPPPSPSFSLTGTALSPASIAAGATSTSTVTVTPANGFNSAVALTCAITPVTAVPPTCNFSSASVAGGSGTSTLTVTTKAAVASLRPNRERTTFYAMLLPLGGLTLLGAGLTSRRRKLLGLLLVCLMVSGLIFMLACGGGSSGGGGGGGGGTPGTTAGAYTVTITGTAGTMTQSVTPALTVTVQ